MFQRRACIRLCASTSGQTRPFRSVSPHAVLGVTPQTPFQEIKSRFHELARFYHPDMPHGDPNKFREINAAYRLLRAVERERRGTHFTQSDASRRSFWSDRPKDAQEKTHAYDRPQHPQPGRGIMREVMWFYEGYELALILGAGVAVVVVAMDRYLLVQRLTREKRARLRAMDEGLPPVMPMVLDGEMVGRYSEPVPAEARAMDTAMVREDVYYRRATQRRFEDFREYMFIFDPDGVTSRKVTTTRFSVQYMDEDLIPQRCAFVEEFNSEEKGARYEDISRGVTETLAGTPWQSPDAQYIAPIIAKGLASIPVNAPDTAKWTFIEYKDLDGKRKDVAPSCLMALRNHRFPKLGMCQRVTVTGNGELSPKMVKNRDDQLRNGALTKKSIVNGGVLPIKDLSIPLEHMKL